MTDVLFSISTSDAKRSLLYMPFDVVLPDSYADWHKVSCESVGMLMTNARLNAFELMLHQCTASLSKQEGYGAVLLSSPAIVLMGHGDQLLCVITMTAKSSQS